MIRPPQNRVPQVSILRPGFTHFLLIPLAALFAAHPLAVHGCSCGHDFDFHMVSWMEAARQFSQGNLHPHWAFSPAFNAGEPRFVFYPPLSWVLGALLGLLLTHLPGVSQVAGWSATPIVFTWIVLTLSGLALYRLARAFAGRNAALLAAILYLANPYLLFTAYERTAYGEMLAAAWIPLLLLSILRERVTVPGIALPIALLWLTNPPAAVMGSYTLALLALLRIATALGAPFIAHFAMSGRSAGAPGLASETWVSRHKVTLQFAGKTLTGFALGLALAAFYIVPAVWQRRYVQTWQAITDEASIGHNFLFEHTGTSSDALLHDQVLHTASLIAVILLIATATALVAVFIRRKSATEEATFPALPLSILAAGIAFLLTPLSAPLWNHAPEAVFLQFPWRLLAILAPVFALSVAAALDRLPMKLTTIAVAAIALLTLLTLPAYHVFRQGCYDEDTVSSQLAQFQSQAGTDPTDEYTPTAADNSALAENDPPFWLARSPATAPPAAAHGPTPGPAPMHLSVTSPLPEFLILNLRNYPAWHVFLNGSIDSARSARIDGLIALPIPAGASTIDIRYAHTRDQTLGDAVSLLALLVLLALPAMRRPPTRRVPHVRRFFV
jgi:hypothetical protein